MEIVFSQPAPPPQWDLSPRRSPAWLDEPRAPHAETQSTEREGIFPQASIDGCTCPEQEWTTNLLQADVGVKPETSTSEQAATREEFARPPKNRQQQRMTAWGNEQTKQFDPEG